MARIKKQGLDYFPLNTDFIQDRLVRRIMKREGDGALAILLGALSCIYSDKGYYVVTDELFYEDLSTCLFQQNSDDVKRILALAVEYGIFDSALFAQYGILTSAEIQRQFLFSTKRRKVSAIDAEYCLVTDTQECDDKAASEVEDVTIEPQNVTSGTHSIAQHSIAQNSTAYPLLKSSPTGGTEVTDETSLEEDFLGGGEINPAAAAASATPAQAVPPRAAKREWTEEEIGRLQPPNDGANRNLDGLIANLRQYRIPLREQYVIILKSNYGIIGHPLWKGFFTLRESHGKINQPGRYLLSLCHK